MRACNEHQAYHRELRREWNRVIMNDPVARTFYDMAASCGEPEEWRIRAAVVALSNANADLRGTLQKTADELFDAGYRDDGIGAGALLLRLVRAALGHYGTAERERTNEQQ